MPTLTQPQVEMVARASGLPGDPKVWAAVAMAESSGNTTAKNPSSGAYGLWQIHPIHRQDYPTWTEKWLSDPVNNARAAAKVHAKQGWGAWEAYTSGAYKRYLTAPVTRHPGQSAQQVMDVGDWLEGLFGPPGSLGRKLGEDMGEDIGQGQTPELLEPLEGAVDVAQGVATIAEGIFKAGVWMAQPKNWLRVAYVAGGGLLVGIGAYMIASPVLSKAGAAVASKTPAGKAVKAVRKVTKRATKAPAKTTGPKTKTGGGSGGAGTGA
jgi:hypothetical protein